VLLWGVTVQGERAAGEIAAAIRGFNALPVGGAIPRPDVLIVARGGGSFEDLLAFSEEIVVRAAAESQIPLISAVGHETDTTLIDFASDKRAPTPTAAAEMAVPVLRDLLEAMLGIQQRLLRAVSRTLARKREGVVGLARALPRADALFALPRQRFDHSAGRLRTALFQNLQRHRASFAHSAALLRPRMIASEIERGRKTLAALDMRLDRAYGTRLRQAAISLDGCGRVLESVSYRAVLARGFALVRGSDGALKRRAAAIRPGEALTLGFADGEAKVTAAGKAETRTAKPQAKPKGQGDLF
jgi:exodeoxyribonuclease VII large subunit